MFTSLESNLWKRTPWLGRSSRSLIGKPAQFCFEGSSFLELAEQKPYYQRVCHLHLSPEITLSRASSCAAISAKTVRARVWLFICWLSRSLQEIAAEKEAAAAAISMLILSSSLGCCRRWRRGKSAFAKNHRSHLEAKEFEAPLVRRTDPPHFPCSKLTLKLNSGWNQISHGHQYFLLL